MKKQLAVILLSALILSGCVLGRMGNPGVIMAGVSIGGSLGSPVGGLVGDNNHGWRDGYRSPAIRNIVGTVAGAVTGNVLTAPRQRQVEEDAYIPKVREVRMQRYKKQPMQQSISQLKLRRIRLIDDNRSHAADMGESGKIILEIMNEGKNPVHDIISMVGMTGKVKHLDISPSVMMEEIFPGEGIRHTTSTHIDRKLKDDEVAFRVAVAGESGVVRDS